MKKYLYSLAALSVLAATFILLNINFNKKAGSDADSGSPMQIKNKIDWDIMRMRDPATGRIPNGIHAQELAFASNLPGSLRFMNNKYYKMLSQRWDQRGPVNIGGRTRALALDVNNENVIIAGGVSGGMWRSTNGGQSWNRTTSLNQLASVTCVAQDIRAGKTNTWYYGTGEFLGNSARINGDGIFKSTDGGLSWSPLPSTTTGTPNVWDGSFEFVWNIITNHKNLNQDEVFAATCLGSISRSTDGGATWKSVLGGFGNSYSYYTDIAISPAGIYYATLSERNPDSAKGSVKRGIYRSTDGVNWTDITPPNFPKKYNRVVIGISPSDESQVYFLSETPRSGKWTLNLYGDTMWHSLWKYTYKSGDGSGGNGTWEDRSQSLPKPDYLRGHFNTQGCYDMIVRVKPDNPDIVFIGATNLYRSTDGFKTPDKVSWIAGYNPDSSIKDYTSYPNQHPDHHSMVFSPSNPNILITGSDGGVHKTLNNMADNVTWISLNNGYYTTQFYTVALNHTSGANDEMLGGLQDNSTQYTNSDNVNSYWTSPTGGDGFTCAIADDGKYYYSSNNSMQQPKIKIWRLKLDKNGNNIEQTRIDPIGGRDFLWCTPFVLDPNNCNRMYLAGGRIVWRNNDLAGIPPLGKKDSISVNWDSLGATRVSGYISAISASKNPANIVYYGTSDGHVYRINNANSGNPAPVEITGSGFPKNSYVSCVAIDETDANKAMVVFSNYNVISLFYTKNGGQSWIPVAGNLEASPNGSGSGPACLWAQIMNIKGRNLYLVGTTTGLYSSAYLDSIYTVWEQEGAETIGNTVIDMIDARTSDGYVIVGTHGHGTFSAKITTLPALPASPVLVSPNKDAKGILTQTTLKWNTVDGAFYYKVEASKDPEFNTIEYTADGITNNSFDISSLEQGYVKYYWRVYAKSSAGISPASEAWSFITAINPPNVIYPLNGAISIPTSLDLQWEKIAGAKSYHVQLTATLGFKTTLIDTIVNDVTSLHVSGLKAVWTHYWRVSSIDENGEGAYGKNSKFVTGNQSAVDEMFYIAELIYLKQNYPNPFNSRTTIDFRLDKPGQVSLKIFDIRGSQVAVLLNQYMNSGDHSAFFDSGNLPPGDYLYVITTGNYTLSRKMSIVK